MLLLTTSAAVVVRQVFVVRMARRAACSIGARNLLGWDETRGQTAAAYGQHVCTLLVLEELALPGLAVQDGLRGSSSSTVVDTVEEGGERRAVTL